MVIISRYTLNFKQEIQAFIVVVDEVIDDPTAPRCPCCNGRLKHRDSKKRIWQKEGGQKDYILIRRLKCEKCGRMHNELPDCLTPYKHYGTEVISGVLDGIVTPEDAESEDYPCESTMYGWFRWFHCILAIIEATLRRLASSVFGLGKDILSGPGSCVQVIQEHYQDWLERCIRLVYNSGGSLLISKQ